MNINRTILLMSAVIILLAGISIGQYLHINKQSTSVAELKAEILAELRQPVTSSYQDSTNQYQDAKTTNRQDRSVSSDQPPVPPKALSDTQYWISKDYSDEHPYGYSAWAVLVAGGNFILERCRAPDYTDIQINAEVPPDQIPECHELVNTKITDIDETQVVIATGKTIPVKLVESEGAERLTLDFEGISIVLEPGSKNSLLEGLTFLPSVKQAQQNAWNIHSKMRNK
jgi:hypothetical protein